jgi:hypothetical protein
MTTSNDDTRAPAVSSQAGEDIIEALASAKSLIAGSDNITYPSRIAAKQVRGVISKLISAAEAVIGEPFTDEDDSGSAIFTREPDDTLTLRIRSPLGADYSVINISQEIWAKLSAIKPAGVQATSPTPAPGGMELADALKPFARISLRHDTDPSGPDMIEAPDLAITPNDVRRARKALAREG